MTRSLSPIIGVGFVVAVVLAAAQLGACDSSDPEAPAPTTTASGGHGAGGDGGAGGQGAGIERITLFHTSDEHGWLLPDDVSNPVLVQGGAANLMGWLVEREGYVPGAQLLLSGGDNWTGHSVSTWFEGQPMVEAFNAMGYAAAAVGNHEFDFGQDVLAARASEAQYPYLAANLHEELSGEPPSFVTPYVIAPVGGVDVGIIGLALEATAITSQPSLVAGLVFTEYRAALEQHVPDMRADGADIVVVLAHAPAEQLADLALELEVSVHVMLAGHAHVLAVDEVAGIPIVSSGSNLHLYNRIDFDYDHGLDDVVFHEVSTVMVQYVAGGTNPVTPDPDVQAVAEDWQEQADAVLGQVVGYSQDGIVQQSWAMANWVTDSWLWAYPEADFALQNFGSLRQSMPIGDITVGDVVGMLPFENDLYLVELTGAQLLDALADTVQSCAAESSCYPSVAGMRFQLVGPDLQVTIDGGGALEPATTYTVLTTSYLYYAGGYTLQSYDPTPVDTGTHMRQPVVDWTTGLGTSAADPLENYLDPAPRDQ